MKGALIFVLRLVCAVGILCFLYYCFPDNGRDGLIISSGRNSMTGKVAVVIVVASISLVALGARLSR